MMVSSQSWCTYHFDCCFCLRDLASTYCWQTALCFVLAALPQTIALYRALTLQVEDPRWQGGSVTVLEGSGHAQDDEAIFAEPLTWVPNCDWYHGLPCACQLANFCEGHGRIFWPGWQRLWHWPTIKVLLGAQSIYELVWRPTWHPEFLLHGPAMAVHVPYELFWPTSPFGMSKNSLQVGLYIWSADAQVNLVGAFGDMDPQSQN